MSESKEHPREIVSFLTLRRTLGILGVLLPVLLAVGCITAGTCTGLQDSISDYYATEMRDVFVGVLFAIAWFLFAYRGYECMDDVAGDVACVCALGVALFPNSSSIGVIRILHFVSAGLLFLVLACFSLFLFTKSKKGVPLTRQKKRRNKLYVACGVIMLLCVALIPLYYAFLRDTSIAALKPVFWLESLALWVFGISWLTKGETLWKDTDA